MAKKITQNLTKQKPDSEDQAARLFELVERTNKTNPAPHDLAALRDLLAQTPALSRLIPNPAQLSEAKLASVSTGQPGQATVLRAQCKDLRTELTLDSDGPLEQLLIDAVVQAWFLYHLIAIKYAAFNQETHSITQARWWEDRLNAAQRRYLRAIESLARTRNLIRKTPSLQLNIATAGGRQINVAGNLPDQAPPENIPEPGETKP